MKQFLLLTFIVLPSILLAQPTLTFNPADGATNVSTTGNLTIISSDGLKTTTGVNLDNDNVDDLISLLDENFNSVPFAASISGDRREITITPSSDLEELHEYTLNFQPVENNSGAETSLQTIVFQTGDFTAPTFSLARAVENKGTEFTFKVNVSEGATVFYVVDRDASLPLVDKIRMGQKADGSPAEKWGSFDVTANIDAQVSVTGLDFSTPVKFHIYFFAEDYASPKNITNAMSRGIPLLKSSSIPGALVGPHTFDLRVNVDEAVTTYYVVTQSSVQPTAAQILNAQDASGASPVASGSFGVAATIDTDHSITGLDDQTTYHVHFVSIDGAGNQTIVESESTTTTDGTSPKVVSMSPSDNSTAIDISTNTFTIVFDEIVSISNASGGADDVMVRLFEDAVMVEDIDRNDVNVGMDGSIVTNGTTNAVITFAYDLLPNRNYHILIGNKVFQDASQNTFEGFSASSAWNFSTSGVTINNAPSSICSGSFQSVGNIEISETGVGDFNNGASQKLILSLENSSEFAFLTSGLTISGESADVTSLSVSVGLATLTITYTVTGETVLDKIIVSGLKVYATGASTLTTIRRSGGNADQDGNNGTGASSLTYATIAVFTTATPVPVLETLPAQKLTFCQNEDITSATVAVKDGTGTFTWYNNASLSTPLATGYQVNVVDLNINSSVIGTVKRYVVHVDGCQSDPLEVIFQVGANPVADAGPDKTVCTGTELTLGGNPTLAVPSAPGAYTYSWAYVEDAPEPAAVANPLYTVTNSSTTSNAIYNFEVTITDANGCTGTDVTTIEVKHTFDISLISPTSLTFTPNSPNLTLAASPAGGVFSGVGIIQSNAPSTYQFSPATAHATDPNTLPKSFPISYTVSQDGCSQTDDPIAIFTISNSFFSTLQPEYCGNEYPDPNEDGVILRLDATGYTSVDNRKNSWNTSERFTRITPWQPNLLHVYGPNTYVKYNNEIYRCANTGGCLALGAPDANGQWVNENVLKVTFNGLIANYYEDYYGGNKSDSTIVELESTYTVGGKTFHEYRFGTNVNYNDCPTCDFAWPAAYLEFERPEDIQLMLPSWSPAYYFYKGDLVSHLGNVYKCLAPSTTNSTPQPNDSNPVWQNVTALNYSNGQYFHKRETPTSPFRSGFYVNGQYVQINRNPTVFFSGLADDQEVCEFDVLNLDNPTSSVGITYNLTGNFSNQTLAQQFFVKLEGTGHTFDNGGGTIVNNVLNPGTATFDTRNAFMNSTGGGASVKDIKIKYQVHPGTTGSTAQACYGESTITVNVVQNSTFNFDNIVDPEGSVYCYTEPSKNLRGVVGATVINGTAGSTNSVVFSGYGVNDLGNSLGVLTPGVALNQINPGTTVQQSVPVTAIYRDANQCRSTRVRTFKVNPDINPSFTFGGRVNYCYEDITNSFSGHFEDFTANSATVTSTGNYNFMFRDPDNNPHLLQAVNSNNTSFTAKTFYDQIQNILASGGFTGDINQTANVNVIYTETLNAGAVCSESFTQAMIINPPITLDIFGLNEGDILCRNDNTNVSQGNLVSFDGNVTGSGIFSLDDDTDFTSVNTTLNGTVNTLSGKAMINLLSAYNAASDASDPRQVYLQYRYTAPGCTGPASITKGFNISPPPPVAFDFSLGNSPANGEIFCNDETPLQLKTIQNTNVSLSGYGITDSGTGNGVATFNPGLAFNTSVSNGGSLNSKQNVNVVARILDGAGCANVTSVTYIVNPVPQAQVNFNADEFCYEDAPGLITGQQVKSWYTIEYLGGTLPYTENIGNISSPQSQIAFNPKARFDHAITFGASALTPVNFNVYYYVADADNCTSSVGPTLVSVANRIDVRIAGLDNDDIFCSNDTKGEKSLTFTPYPADASKREFTINGETQSITTDKYTFKPPLLGGDFLLEYVVFSGENNCSNTNAVSVKVLPSPKAIFKPEPACDGDLIDFNADGTSNLPSAIYTWVMPDLVLSGQNIQHRFQGTNLFGVNLKVQYPAYNNDPTLVCQDSLRLDQVVGAIPQNLAFKYFNVCEDDQTAFGIQPDIPVSQISWDFGDGVATPLGFSAEQVQAVNSTAGTYQSPVHTFQGAGSYNVIVTGKTADIFGGCERIEAHSISILNNWAPSPAEPFYEMSQINGGNGYWVEEDLAGNSTWEFNTATKKRIITNEMAWVTGPLDPYKEEDISYVNSPCFDLSSFSRPVISLNHWADTDLSDGAVVQYSIDGGESWTRLGNVASGLAWYNQLTIQSNPGGQQDLTSGWSTLNQRGWNTGKHTLDVIPFPRNQVRFRVAFSSFKNREGRDGFAFNNVVIEERNRTILVENFTQLDQGDNNDGFKDFKAFNGTFNPNEVVKLQYHHSSATPGAKSDELHLDNPVDQDARAAFYGVTNPVRAFIDGGFGQLPASVTFPSTALNTYFELRSLVTSPVNISIDFLPESDPAQLNVKAIVQATSDLGEPGNYNVFIAIAEQSIMDQIYVLRKFLPNAAGTPLTSLSESDPAQEIIASYDMRHVTRLPNGEFAPFAVIVFVQHLETKDVLQTTMRQDGTASSEIVTGLEISFDNYIRVYPNPADDIMNIILPSPVKEHTPIKLFDSFGRQVYAGTFNQGEHLKTLDTKPLPAGVYLIQIMTDKGLVQKKVMIVHE